MDGSGLGDLVRWSERWASSTAVILWTEERNPLIEKKKMSAGLKKAFVTLEFKRCLSC